MIINWNIFNNARAYFDSEDLEAQEWLELKTNHISSLKNPGVYLTLGLLGVVFIRGRRLKEEIWYAVS